MAALHRDVAAARACWHALNDEQGNPRPARQRERLLAACIAVARAEGRIDGLLEAALLVHERARRWGTRTVRGVECITVENLLRDIARTRK